MPLLAARGVLGLVDFGHPAVLFAQKWSLSGATGEEEWVFLAGSNIALNLSMPMKRIAETTTLDVAMHAPRATRRGPSEGRVLEFPVGRKAAGAARTAARKTGPGRRLKGIESRQAPQDRFLRALEMEQRGFADGAILHLRTLYREVDADSDPCLAIGIRYFLGSFLKLRGEADEAREVAEDGILLAWEHGAAEELEMLESLSLQLGG
jgi:hypothetical protein